MIKNILLLLFSFALLAYPQSQTIHGGDFNAGQANSTTPATIGFGVPSGSTCAGVAHRGRMYTRLDPPSTNAAVYVCLESSSGSGVFNWTAQSGSSPMTYPGTGVPNSTGSAWGTSYTVGVAPNNLVQLNGSSQLPAVSGALLTNLPGALSIGGTDGQVQWNNGAGALGADSGFAYNSSTKSLGIIGTVVSGQPVTGTGAFKVNGVTSGTLTITAADAITDYSLKFPGTGGAAGQFLQTNGSGTTSWAMPAAIATPASAAASCVAGKIAADTEYIYVCIATDTWLRAAIITWTP